MSNALSTLAQNVAILANGIELGSQIVMDIAGGEDVGNSYNGQPVDPATIQSWIADELATQVRPVLGG